MPSASWRFWTDVAHYIELFQLIFMAAPRLAPRYLHPVAALYGVFNGLRDISKLILRFLLLPPRHGERGNAITEIYYFGSGWWRRHFIANGFVLLDQGPVGLFYTGHMVLGARLDMRSREKFARWFGSACNLFKVIPTDRRDDRVG